MEARPIYGTDTVLPPSDENKGQRLVNQLLQEKDREMEELEKAHIYIEQLHNQNKTLEARLRRVEQALLSGYLNGEV